MRGRVGARIAGFLRWPPGCRARWWRTSGLGRTSVSELRMPADDSGAHPLTGPLLPPSKITSEN